MDFSETCTSGGYINSTVLAEGTYAGTRLWLYPETSKHSLVGCQRDGGRFSVVSGLDCELLTVRLMLQPDSLRFKAPFIPRQLRHSGSRALSKLDFQHRLPGFTF